MKIDIGVHDIVWKQGEYSTNGLDTRDVSFFSVLSNEKTISNYIISSHFGVGTGKIVQYAQVEQSNPQQKIGVFFGIQFKAPL